MQHGIIREKLSGSSTWSTIENLATPGGITSFTCLTLDIAGNLYVGGQAGPNWTVLERPAGQNAFSAIDAFAPSRGGTCNGIAVDASGDVFAVGLAEYSAPNGGLTNDWAVREQTGGQGGFATVENFAGDALGVTTIAAGPAAGVYVSGSVGQSWTVRKSTDGGNTWSTVDNFQYDPASNGTDSARGLAADASGNLFVVGYGNKGTVTGGTKTHPTYTYTSHWLVRESSNGGGSWSIVDDYLLSSTTGRNASAAAVGTDLAGPTAAPAASSAMAAAVFSSTPVMGPDDSADIITGLIRRRR